MTNETPKPEDVDDAAGVLAEGHILIRDITDEDHPIELVNKRNAIHFGNFAKHVAYSLAGKPHFNIHFMAFGNGGSSVTSAGTILYKQPNVSNAPDLVNPTSRLHSYKYHKVVNDLSTSNTATQENKIDVIPSGGAYTDIRVTCTLAYSEPSAQSAYDNGDINGDFVFDELALFSLDPGTGNEDFANSYMLTHVVFHPIQKSQNRRIEVVYTVRIQML